MKTGSITLLLQVVSKNFIRHRSEWKALLIFIIGLTTAFQTCASSGKDFFKHFGFGFYFSNSQQVQSDLSTVLQVSGYRSGVNDPVVSLQAAPVLLDFSYRWSGHLQLDVIYSLAGDTYGYYNYNSSIPSEKDYLELSVRPSGLSMKVDFILLPYRPLWKKLGFQLSVSSGIQGVRLKEELNVSVPYDDSLNVSRGELFLTSAVSTGLSSTFAFDAALQFNEHLSVIPFRLVWNVPVLRPSFSRQEFRTSDNTRVLGGRNYDCGGLFWYLGAAFHF
jgi:hypothetical protein